MTTLLERGKKIYYIGIHKQIFEIKNFYPLDIFDSFVTQIETTSENCYLESSCKI
jgi:LynF/TruF/PatF family peptide O-prenyltransferase